MDTDGNGQARGSATASTTEAGERSTCAGSRQDGKDSVTINAIPPVASTELSGPRSTVEMPADDDAAKTLISQGSTHDGDSTPFWDSQATMPSWVESTLGAWKSTSPVWSSSNKEVVPGFEILLELGRGGMGVVYKARQERLKRLVALKMIRDDWHGNPEHLARFEIEAEAVARLHHPNIVGIYEIGKAGRVPYVVLELLEGGSLKERLAGTPQPFREAAALLATLARGVNAAHVAGILHRDLKPSNVLFDQAGIPKIADFGLAKRLEVDEGQTHTGEVIGTPSYMAPEQAKGWDRDIGPAADIYSLGAILYEMLTGRPPLKGTTPVETLRLVQEEEPVSPSRLRPKLPFDLETICLKCIARDPRKRYPNALRLAEDLERYLDGESILARRTPLWERGIKRARKRPVLAVLVAVGVVSSAIVTEELLRTRSQARAQQQQNDDRMRGLLQEADQELIEAERSHAQGRLDDVNVIASRVLSRFADETDSRIAATRDRAERLLGSARLGLKEQAARDEARTRFRRFGELRDEAYFLDTTRFADNLGNSAEAAGRAARGALKLFGVGEPDGSWALASLPTALSPQEGAEVERGCFQLLLILADAVAQSPGAPPAQLADAALGIVNQAEGLPARKTRAYHLRRSDFLEMKGDGQAAANERAIAKRCPPVDALDFFLMARESVKRSDWPDAIEQLTAATHRQPDHFWVRCWLAIGHLQTGEPQSALIGLNACINSKADQPWLYMFRGLANTKVAEAKTAKAGASKAATDAFKDAEDDFNRALERLGDKAQRVELYYAILVNRGMMWLVRDEPAAAVSDFQQAIGHLPQRYEALAHLGQAYQLQDRTDDAWAALGKAIEQRPSWAPLYRARAGALLGLKDLTPELGKTTVKDLEDAIRKVSIERRAAAARDLDLAIQYELPGNQLIAADWTKLAALLREARLYDEAIDACDEAIEIVPRYLRAHELRIKSLLDLKRYEKILASCNALLEWAQPTAKILELRAVARNATQDFTGAIGDFTHALDLADETDRPRILCRRGWSYAANDADQLALKDFDATIRLDPADADAYVGRGLTYARLGQYREAEADASNATRHDDASPNFAFRLACVYGQAAATASAGPRQSGPRPVRQITGYQNSAITWVRRALERTPAGERSSFLRKTIKPDPALKSIRRALDVMERQ
jgi:eukaryotic-like serine/threonine-protein kinase